MSPLQRLEHKIDRMNKVKPHWISEDEAARLLGYKPNILRRFCTGTNEKKLPIHTSKPNYRTVLYNKNDIDQYLLETSTII